MTFLHLFSISGHIILHQNRYTDNETYYLPHSLQRELVSNWNHTGNEVSPDWRMTFPWNTTWGTLRYRTSPTGALTDKGHPGYHHWLYWRWSVSQCSSTAEMKGHSPEELISHSGIYFLELNLSTIISNRDQHDLHLIKTDMPCTLHVNCPEMCIVWPNPALIFNLTLDH